MKCPTCGLDKEEMLQALQELAKRAEQRLELLEKLRTKKMNILFEDRD